jgi:hypothetical protein
VTCTSIHLFNSPTTILFIVFGSFDSIRSRRVIHFVSSPLVISSMCALLILLLLPLNGSFAPNPPLPFVVIDSFDSIRSLRVIHFVSSPGFISSICSLRYIFFLGLCSFRKMSTCLYRNCHTNHISSFDPNLIHICRYVRDRRGTVADGCRNQRRLLDH